MGQMELSRTKLELFFLGSIMTFWIGLLGSLVLISGAAYPVRDFQHPVESVKNCLFASGGLLMLSYSVLNYLEGGPIFFVFLQGLVNVASVLMLSNSHERISTPVIIGLGMVLMVWSLLLFEGLSTVFFIIGLTGVATGYVLKSGTFRRNLALMLGSLLIALFSLLVADWMFFWLNVFFSVFSGWHAWRLK